MKRVAWVSPLSPSPALKTARFSAQLLPVLSEQWDIEVFVDDFDWNLYFGERQSSRRAGRSDRFSVYQYHRIYERDSIQPFDLFIYQLEDHPRCNFVRLAAAVWPGICYLHDSNLNDLYFGLYKHTTAPTEINDLVLENFGEQAPCLGEYHVRGWSAEIFDKRYSLGSQDAKTAAVLGVFSEHDARRLCEICRDKEIFVSPVPVSVESCRGDSSNARRKEFGFSADDVVIGFCGERYLADRIIPTLQALAILRTEISSSRQVAMLWFVWDEASKRRAQDTVARFPELDSLVHVIEVSDERTLAEFLAGCNAVCAMRFDLCRAVPPAVIIALAEGVPVIAADHGASAELPRDAVLHVPLGRGEESYLAKALKEIAENSELTRQLGESGRAFALRTSSVASTVGALHDATERWAEHIAEELSESRVRMHNAQQKLLEQSAVKIDGERSLIGGQDLSARLLDSCREEFSWKR